MTRNRELDCEDLFDCDHTPEVAIRDQLTGQTIIGWRCRCGKEVECKIPEEEKPK